MDAVQQIVRGILNGAPIWVWPLLFVLLILGYLASKPRKTPFIALCFIPLFGLISLNSIASLPLPDIGWWSFVPGYILGICILYQMQRRWLLGREGRMVSLAGEWFTMFVLMVMFWANFVSGMTKQISPEIYTSPIFVASFAFIVGTVSGSFLGRTLRVIRFMTSSSENPNL